MTFPKHIWGGGVTLQMGLLIKRNVHSNPRASRTDDFHRGTAQVIYCIHLHMYDIYLYIIYLIIYIYIAFPPWITHRNTALYQQKSTKSLLQRLVAGAQLSQVLRSHSCICRSPTWRPPPGFLGPETTPRFVGDGPWRFVGGSGKWFPSRWVSGRNFGNLTWNHDYWSKGIYMYNHVHKYLCIYMCIYFYSIFIHLYMFIYIYMYTCWFYVHACMYTYTCIHA